MRLCFRSPAVTSRADGKTWYRLAPQRRQVKPRDFLAESQDGNVLVDDQWAPLTDKILAAVRTLDPELWVDRIPYKETREYVRKIVAQRARYRELLGEDVDVHITERGRDADHQRHLELLGADEGQGEEDRGYGGLEHAAAPTERVGELTTDHRLDGLLGGGGCHQVSPSARSAGCT